MWTERRLRAGSCLATAKNVEAGYRPRGITITPKPVTSRSSKDAIMNSRCLATAIVVIGMSMTVGAECVWLKNLAEQNALRHSCLTEL